MGTGLHFVLSAAVLGALVLLACESTLEPTPGPAAAPQPTYTPLPTYTPFPTLEPASVAAGTLTPVPTPTPEPKLSLDPGTYTVGSEIAPGIYVGHAGASLFDSCYWERLSGVSGTFDDIMANANATGQFYLEVQPTDKYLKTDCEITPLEYWPAPAQPLTEIGPGMYLVGRDIAPGTYRGEAGNDVMSSCYWERLSGLSAEFDDLIANDNSTGQFYVSVDPSDHTLSTDCKLALTEPSPAVTTEPTPTSTPLPTATPTPVSTTTPTPVSTATPTSVPTATPTPVPTATPTPVPTATPLGPPSTPLELMQRVQAGIVRVEAGYRSSGSGFIFAIEETTAFIATNHHVIEDANAIDVYLIDGQSYEALLLGWDADRDVAVLAVCCSYDFTALPWEPISPGVGTQVVAVGYPRGSVVGVTATVGEVVESDAISTHLDFIPHSAPLNPGNSGGPLFSMPEARVLGINTARGTETLSFYAVPYQAIEEPMKEWRAKLVIAPVPTPTPTVIFGAVAAGASTYTVNEIRDPAPARRDVDPGKRLIAIDITQHAFLGDDPYNPLYFSVQDSDGYVYSRGGYADVEPRFSSGDLARGQSVRGWVSFTVPQSAVLISVMVEVGYSSPSVVIADLTPSN